MPTPPLPEPGEEVVQQSRVADPERQRIGAEAGLGTFPKQLITYLEYRQSRVLNAINNLVNVVVGAVVDASVYAFAAQAVIFLFASLDVIFNANLFHLPYLEMSQQASNPHQSLRFVLLGPADVSSWSSSFRCCGFIDSPKR